MIVNHELNHQPDLLADDKSKKVEGKVVDAAWNLIERRLDTVTMVKELMSIRFIVRALLSKEQRSRLIDAYIQKEIQMTEEGIPSDRILSNDTVLDA